MQERKCNKQKKSELHCENLQTKGKKCKASKAKELWPTKLKKKVSQTRTSKYKSKRNFQVKEQSGAQVRLGPLYLCEDEKLHATQMLHNTTLNPNFSFKTLP